MKTDLTVLMTMMPAHMSRLVVTNTTPVKGDEKLARQLAKSWRSAGRPKDGQYMVAFGRSVSVVLKKHCIQAMFD